MKAYWIPGLLGTMAAARVVWACEPLSYHPAPVVVLYAEDTVSWYCVFQFQVMVDGMLTVMIMESVEPEAGVLPVPDQPVHMYCVPVEPADGVPDNVSVTWVPALTHSLLGVGVP